MMTKTGVMRNVADIETAALLLAVYGMAPLILSDSIKKILGGEITDPEISEKLARSSLELFALIREGQTPPQTKERAGEK